MTSLPERSTHRITSSSLEIPPPCRAPSFPTDPTFAANPITYDLVFVRRLVVYPAGQTSLTAYVDLDTLVNIGHLEQGSLLSQA